MQANALDNLVFFFSFYVRNFKDLLGLWNLMFRVCHIMQRVLWLYIRHLECLLTAVGGIYQFGFLYPLCYPFTLYFCMFLKDKF